MVERDLLEFWEVACLLGSCRCRSQRKNIDLRNPFRKGGVKNLEISKAREVKDGWKVQCDTADKDAGKAWKAVIISGMIVISGRLGSGIIPTLNEDRLGDRRGRARMQLKLSTSARSSVPTRPDAAPMMWMLFSLRPKRTWRE